MLKYLTFMCAIAYQRLERGYYTLVGGAVPKNISTLWGFLGMSSLLCARDYRASLGFMVADDNFIPCGLMGYEF